MKAFVAGASGMIGLAVVSTLMADGHQLFARLRSDFAYIAERRV